MNAIIMIGNSAAATDGAVAASNRSGPTEFGSSYTGIEASGSRRRGGTRRIRAIHNPRKYRLCLPARLVPLHRGFDDLLGAGSQRWEGLRVDEQFDAAGDAGFASDQTSPLEGQHHLMDRGRRDLEMALQVGLGGWPAGHEHIGMNEGQILTLLFGEALRAGAGHGA
jgi:hypothetical protein